MLTLASSSQCSPCVSCGKSTTRPASRRPRRAGLSRAEVGEQGGNDEVADADTQSCLSKTCKRGEERRESRRGQAELREAGVCSSSSLRSGGVSGVASKSASKSATEEPPARGAGVSPATARRARRAALADYAEQALEPGADLVELRDDVLQAVASAPAQAARRQGCTHLH